MLSLLNEREIELLNPDERVEYLQALERRDFLEDQREARDLRTFARRAWEVLEPATALKWNWHLDYIAEYLQLVRNGTIRRLIVNQPPQTMKSRFITVFFPAWWWSSDPSRRFLSASYSGGALGLSTLHSLERRRVIDSQWYRSVWQKPFAWTQFTQQQYENDMGGRMVATSTGATATGKGFHCMILDDLLNPKKAESEAERTTALKFVDNTLRSRLSDQITGSIIIVEQRTHEQDVSGHVTNLEPGVWTNICFRMVAEEDEVWKFPISGRVVERKKGELLQPERFPEWVCESLKVGMGSRSWNAQYQQRPSPAEGIIFNPSDWRYYVQDPANAHDDIHPAPRFEDGAITVDCAFKDKAESDNVAIHAWGFVGPRNYLIKRSTCRRGYTATKMAIREMKQEMVERKIPIDYCLIEDKANGSAVIEEMKRGRWGMSIIAIEPMGGKVARAWGAQPEQEAGNCFLPEDADDTPKFINDCAVFPAVEHDDDVDAFTQLVNWRRRMGNGLFELWAQQAKEQRDKDGVKLDDPTKTPAERAQVQADAQMKQGIAYDDTISRTFGQTVNKVSMSGMAKPATNKETPKCPRCGNAAISRYRAPGTSGDMIEECACGWQQRIPK